MKEEKLFKIIESVDDDLICEMMEYSPESKIKGEVSEGVLYSVPAGRKRTGQLWKYPVTAAALLGVMGGALFVIDYSGNILGNTSTATDGEATEAAEETGNEAASATTDNTSEETTLADEKTPPHVVPIKVVQATDNRCALYIDSYPEIPQPNFGEEYFTEMSTMELCGYYGLPKVAAAIANKQMAEITDESTSHGIYTLPDGSIYDINTFTFELLYDDLVFAKKFTITVGKKKIFGQEYYFEVDHGFAAWSLYYNEERGLLFSADEINGCSIMFSGKVDEISAFDSSEIGDMLKEYDNRYREANEGLPYAHSQLIQVRGYFLIKDTDANFYFDEDLGLWYDETNKTYYDEETGNWIPADQVETQPPAGEAPAPIVPLKVVGNLVQGGIFVDSYPDVPQPDFGKEYFTEMSTEELFEYYGLPNKIAEAIENKEIIEITDENTSHGIYTLPDGSIYDINTFTFETTYDAELIAKRLTYTVGKETKFGQEYYEFYKAEGIHPGGNFTAFYNEERDVFFSVHDMVGVNIMCSATVDEILSFDDLKLRESFKESDKEEREKYFGLPAHAMEMFIQRKFRYICRYGGVDFYFDAVLGLWYNEDENTYYDEETGDWIPADQWGNN